MHGRNYPAMELLSISQGRTRARTRIRISDLVSEPVVNYVLRMSSWVIILLAWHSPHRLLQSQAGYRCRLILLKSEFMLLHSLPQ